MAKQTRTESTITHRELVKRMNEVLADFGVAPDQKIKLKSFTIEASGECKPTCKRKLKPTPTGLKAWCPVHGF